MRTKEQTCLMSYCPKVAESFRHPVVLLQLQVRKLLPVFRQQLLVNLREKLLVRLKKL